MKVFVFLTFVWSAGMMSCHQKAETPCYGMVIREEILYANKPDTSAFSNQTHIRTRCAEKCPGGVACDSTIELTNTSMGASVRRVKCSCAPEGIDHEMAIVIEHIRHARDSVTTSVYCERGGSRLEVSAGCMIREVRLPDDTIRSRGADGDSLIVKRWEMICECMD